MRSFFSRNKSNSAPSYPNGPTSQPTKPTILEPPPTKEKREEKERGWFASIAGGGSTTRERKVSLPDSSRIVKERVRTASGGSANPPSRPPLTSEHGSGNSGSRELRSQPSSASMRSSGTRKSTGRRSFFSSTSHQANANRASALFSAFTSSSSANNNGLAPPGEEYRSMDDGGVMGSPRNLNAGGGSRNRTSTLFGLPNGGAATMPRKSSLSFASGGAALDDSPMIISNPGSGYPTSMKSGTSGGGAENRSPKKKKSYGPLSGGVPSLPNSETGHSIGYSHEDETEELQTGNDVSTKSLATRLQELSVAHGDGLLDEEEYRMLRTRLFEKFSNGSLGGGDAGRGNGLAEGGEEVPRLGLASPPRNLSRSAPSTPSRATSNPTTNVSPPRAPSFTSTKSKSKGSRLSIFRRKASTDEGVEGEDEDGWNLVQPNRADVSSILSGRSGTAGATSTHRRNTSASGSDFEVIKTRSIRNHAGLASMSLLGSPTLSNDRGSSRGSVLSGSSEGGSVRPPPSTRSALSSTYSPKISALPPIASSMDPFLFAAAEKEPTSKELRTEIEEIEDEFARVGESWEELERAAVEKWEKSGHGSAGDGRPKRAAVGKKPSLSFISESPSGGVSSGGRPPASLIYASANQDTDEATQILRNELEDIRKRRRATEARYEKRLEYLRARLRGAVIKEKLPR